MKRISFLVPAAALLTAVLPAFAADDVQQLRLAALAATCANCHGTNGAAVDKSVVPGLAGLPAAHIVAQMKEFRTTGRSATVMHQIAKGYTEAQIEQLAAYFATQKR